MALPCTAFGREWGEATFESFSVCLLNLATKAERNMPVGFALELTPDTSCPKMTTAVPARGLCESPAQYGWQSWPPEADTLKPQMLALVRQASESFAASTSAGQINHSRQETSLHAGGIRSLKTTA